MEQPAASDIASFGDMIEITAPSRVDYGQRFQVEASNETYVTVLDNRMRMTIFHRDYKIVKRCGKPATEQPKKKVGRPSNAELAARAAVVTDAELAALQKAMDVPVERKTQSDTPAKASAEQRAKTEHPDTPVAGNDETGLKANIGDLIELVADVARQYQPGERLKVLEAYPSFITAIGPEVGDKEVCLSHHEYRFVKRAGATPDLSIDESKITVQSNDMSHEALLGLDHITAAALHPATKPVKLTQEQFDAMTKQGQVFAGMDFAKPGSDATYIKMMTTEHGVARLHSHYFKPCPFPHVDIYRVLSLFNVTDPCLQHAVKKLLVAGGRGHKDIAKDVQDSIDTLNRWKDMRAEEAA